jgi:hypothetical protein
MMIRVMFYSKTKTVCVALLIIALSGCEALTGFEEFQENPNETTNATPGLLLTNLQIAAFNSIDLGATYASRHAVDVNVPQDTQYYRWDRLGFGFYYDNLRQTQKMREEAERLDNSSMVAVAEVMQVYVFHQLTRRFGDVPYLDALRAEEGLYQPRYTPQEDIYADLLSRLDQVNQDLADASEPINGDVVFSGDRMKWRKFANSLRLRILISLSEKQNTGIDYAGQFSQVFNNPGQYPVMESLDDNCQYTYNEATGDTYPFFNTAAFTSRVMEETLVDLYKAREDPRLFRLAAPADPSVPNAETSFAAHSGLIASATLQENSDLLSAGTGSLLDERYLNDPEAEPNLALGYPEVAFTIAEAAQRGWISADPETYYNQGIRASMAFYGITGAAVDTYLAGDEVAYDPANGLEMILTQKYMSMFLNSGWEPFFNQRRTQVPAFDVDQRTVLNDGQVPKRWMYPQKELTSNRDNLTEAVERQFGGNDTIDQEMWLISN